MFCVLAAIGLLGFGPGDLAPDFSAKNQDEKLIRLSDLKGSPVLLYFYPADETPGCVKEACAIRDRFERFKKLGIVVLGVSRQGAKSHQAFKKNHKLPFDLLVDADGKLGKAYGVDTMPIVGYLKRVSFLIGADGKIIKSYEAVDPGTHADQVLKDFEAANKK